MDYVIPKPNTVRPALQMVPNQTAVHTVPSLTSVQDMAFEAICFTFQSIQICFGTISAAVVVVCSTMEIFSSIYIALMVICSTMGIFFCSAMVAFGSVSEGLSSICCALLAYSWLAPPWLELSWFLPPSTAQLGLFLCEVTPSGRGEYCHDPQ